MALSRTDLLSETSGSGHGTGSYVTGSFTPPDNSLLVVCLAVENQNNNATHASITVAGGGWTFTKQIAVDQLTDGTDCTAIFTAPVTTGASMTLTIDCGAEDIYRYVAHVFAENGHNTSSPIGATGTFGTVSGANPSSFSLNAPPASSSEIFAIGLVDGGANTLTAGTGWSEIASTIPDVEVKTERRTGSTSTTVLWNAFTSGTASGGSSVALEIKADTTPVQVGSVLRFELASPLTDSGSQNIDVPAGTTFILIGLSSTDTGNSGRLSTGAYTFTKGGVPVAMTAVGADSNTNLFQGALIYLAGPDVGTGMTFAWNLGGTGVMDFAGLLTVTFWSSVNQSSPVRDSDGVQKLNNFPITTKTLTALPFDLIVAYTSFFTGGEGSITTWTNATELTEITHHSLDANDCAWATATPSGNQTVAIAAATNWDDGSLLAVVLKPATSTDDLTATGLDVGSPVIGSQPLQETMALADRVIDLGLNVLDTEATHIYITDSRAETYAQATTTYTLGFKSFGAGAVCGSPAAGSPGRKVTAVAVTSGTVNGTGLAAHWAIVDAGNSRLLAAGPLSATVALTSGGSFDLTSFDIHVRG